MKIYREKTISDQTFVLEEVAFFNCTVKNCDLFFSGGDFLAEGTSFENCRLHFLGAAKKTQELFQMFRVIRPVTITDDGPIQAELVFEFRIFASPERREGTAP